MSTLSRTLEVEGEVGEIIDEPVMSSEALPATNEYEGEPAEYSVMIKLIVRGEAGVEALRKMSATGSSFTMVND